MKADISTLLKPDILILQRHFVSVLLTRYLIKSKMSAPWQIYPLLPGKPAFDSLRDDARFKQLLQNSK